MTKTNYTLFIDESGDQDLEKFRTDERQFGSDPHLIFGAALVPNSALDRTRKQLEDLLTQFGSKGATLQRLSPPEKSVFRAASGWNASSSLWCGVKKRDCWRLS